MPGPVVPALMINSAWISYSKLLLTVLVDSTHSFYLLVFEISQAADLGIVTQPFVGCFL